MSIIEEMIKKVLKLIDKTGSEEEKALAHEMVDKVLPKQVKHYDLFCVKGDTIMYKAPNGKTYETTCKGDKFNVYVGCAITYGIYTYGSKTQFQKHLKAIYGTTENTFDTYALFDVYNQFGGKDKFEEFVQKRFKPNGKLEELLKPKEEKPSK